MTPILVSSFYCFTSFYFAFMTYSDSSTWPLLVEHLQGSRCFQGPVHDLVAGLGFWHLCPEFLQVGLVFVLLNEVLLTVI